MGYICPSLRVGGMGQFHIVAWTGICGGKIPYFAMVASAPSAAPSNVLMMGLLVSGQAPEVHLPKYPIPNPIAPPTIAPISIFMTTLLSIVLQILLSRGP